MRLTRSKITLSPKDLLTPLSSIKGGLEFFSAAWELSVVTAITLNIALKSDRVYEEIEDRSLV